MISINDAIIKFKGSDWTIKELVRSRYNRHGFSVQGAHTCVTRYGAEEFLNRLTKQSRPFEGKRSIAQWLIVVDCSEHVFYQALKIVDTHWPDDMRVRNQERALTLLAKTNLQDPPRARLKRVEQLIKEHFDKKS